MVELNQSLNHYWRLTNDVVSYPKTWFASKRRRLVKPWAEQMFQIDPNFNSTKYAPPLRSKIICCFLTIQNIQSNLQIPLYWPNHIYQAAAQHAVEKAEVIVTQSFTSFCRMPSLCVRETWHNEVLTTQREKKDIPQSNRFSGKHTDKPMDFGCPTFRQTQVVYVKCW